MTLTFELDLVTVKTNQHSKYLRKGLLLSKVKLRSVYAHDSLFKLCSSRAEITISEFLEQFLLFQKFQSERRNID